MQKKTLDGPRALSPYSKQLSEEELKARMKLIEIHLLTEYGINMIKTTMGI